MKIVITGSSGLVGTYLREVLAGKGDTVVPVVRGAGVESRDAEGIHWDPEAGVLDPTPLEGCDVVIHLAGANIAETRWTDARKELILRSRAQGTNVLATALAGLTHPPRVLIKASAVGFYGNRDPGEELDEGSPPGTGFLPETCIAWEQAAEPARAAGIRVVDMRFGMILSPRGGALAKMLPVFRLGMGSRFGSGRQMVSWIALEEIGPAIRHCIKDETLTGPVNFTTPHPVSNAEYTRILARVLGRPTGLPVPAFAARALFGEMADWLLLGGANVIPRRLLDSGYRFRWQNLEPALRQMLGS